MVPRFLIALVWALVWALAISATDAHAARVPPGFLAGIAHHRLLTSTQPENGDQNPYAIITAPVSAGSIQKNDVLVDNFNNNANLQGTGTTIIDYRPATGATTLFAAIPRDLPGCPGGVGLSTAMTMLTSGWVIVGSAPSTDGTTKTLGAGCLIVLSPAGKVMSTIAGRLINEPWGNMALDDHGTTATLFVSNAGPGIGAPGTPVQHHATILRLSLSIPPGHAPVVTAQTVIASGLSARADAGVFLIGPTGLALAPNGDLYVSDAISNQILSIPDALDRAAAPARAT
ncbi:MAG: hypothetical protein POH28_16425, partial [Acidocella sp.]|nr:hypothetical protein [Acidocella sp.]